MDKTIQLYAKESFGAVHFYVVDSKIAESVAKMCKTKSITDNVIKHLASTMGYKFELVPNPQYVKYLQGLTK